jgi:predicted O-methyltransferase YrrM
MNRQVKNTVKRALFRVHKLGTRLGVHVLPVHYYSALPDVLDLEKTKDVWARKSELPGLEVDLRGQIRRLRDICIPYQNEYAGNQTYRHALHNHFGSGYGYIEAQALHAVIRHFRPRHVIEVGSGVSTYCMLAALTMNKKEDGQPFSITCVEPHPSAPVRALTEINLIPKNVQTLPFEVFRQLQEKDFLFIDSSHAVKPGSDVNYLILEVLPRLSPGVIVHFHDIYLPYDYSPAVLQTFLHWMETSLLRAFLIGNSRAKIIFCQSHLHHDCKDVLKEVFPEYNPRWDKDGLLDAGCKPFENLSDEHFPSSTYIQMQ